MRRGERERSDWVDGPRDEDRPRSRDASVPCSIWGVLNITPDSFSDGGLFLSPTAALERARDLLGEGADVLDVGGESTRPKGGTYGDGYQDVSVEEEVRRVIPVIERVRAELGARISIDTTKPAVARSALAAGASIVNDVGGGRNVELLEVAAGAGAEVVLMHNRCRGEVGGSHARYKDVVEEVITELLESVERAVAAGLPREKVWIDPGVGFAKTAAESLALLSNIHRLVATGQPVLVGPSRKSFIAKTAPDADGREPRPTERVGGTAAALTAAVLDGAQAVRVHDVALMRQAVRVAEAMRELRRGA